MPKPKPKIYLETSVFSIYYDPRDSNLMNLTRQFWRTLPNYDIHTSDVVITELAATPDPTKRNKLIKLTRPCKLLEINQEISHLSKLYRQQGIIPTKYKADADHLAIATFHQIDILVSWNLEHIVKYKTQTLVNAINKIQAYHKELVILTPQQLT